MLEQLWEAVWPALLSVFVVGILALGIWNWVTACSCGKKRWELPQAHADDCWRLPPDE